MDGCHLAKCFIVWQSVHFGVWTSVKIFLAAMTVAIYLFPNWFNNHQRPCKWLQGKFQMIWFSVKYSHGCNSGTEDALFVCQFEKDLILWQTDDYHIWAELQVWLHTKNEWGSDSKGATLMFDSYFTHAFRRWVQNNTFLTLESLREIRLWTHRLCPL